VDNFNLALTMTPDGELLIASQSYGLMSFDPVRGSFDRVDRHDSKPTGVTDGNVRALSVTKDSTVWFGTEAGLRRLDRRTGNISQFTTADGLPGNTIVGVTVAADGIPWVATNRGLCRFDYEAKSCVTFTLSDNLQGNRFNAFVSLTTRDGRLLFGGPGGFNIVHPERLQVNETPPPVVFTDFQLFNRSVSHVDQSDVLTENISVASNATVTHRQTVLTFEYAALDFTNPSKNQYAYKLEGFDDSWHAVGTRRTATYSNLDPGHYELIVQASNSDGIWNEDGARLGITVLPPFWQTWWFHGLLSLGALGILGGLLRGAHHFGQVGTIKEKLKVEEELRASAQAANLAKDQFLANMSHEIRTPMNGVMGMIELTLDSPLTPAQREYLSMASSSAESLLTIINDILDFSKIEAGMLGIESTPFDVRKKIGTTAKSLAFRAQDKGLELAIDVRPGVPELISGDPVRLAQILVNLVGNAIKFTDAGEITVSVEPWQEKEDATDDGGLTLHFAVRDTGIGIAEDRQAQIFDAFVQADMSTTRFYGGTGLGLVICARLVDLMGGRIWVESTPGTGSVFHFTARFGASEQPARSFALAAPPALEGLPVLVVDDNETNRFILERMLSNWGMQPELVDNGPSAAEMFAAADSPPYSLVLLDYQMPGMDGLEVARRIRAQWRADQVALVMLTSVHEMHLAEQIVALDVAVHVVKPFTQSEVLDGILSVIGSPDGASPAALDSAQRSDHVPDKALRILLVEDNQVNRTLATRILESAGHTVETAWDGNLAIEAVRTNEYDLVLMDMQMPVMDGFEATRHIRALEKDHQRRVPIVALTARAMEGDQAKCLEAGMDGYLSKPVRMAELKAMVAQMARTASA
jgi:signal transduction histidine kinase/CheY-like chemotaxis protein/streptogramin lyase